MSWRRLLQSSWAGSALIHGVGGAVLWWIWVPAPEVETRSPFQFATVEVIDPDPEPDMETEFIDVPVDIEIDMDRMDAADDDEPELDIPPMDVMDVIEFEPINPDGPRLRALRRPLRKKKAAVPAPVVPKPGPRPRPRTYPPPPPLRNQPRRPKVPPRPVKPPTPPKLKPGQAGTVRYPPRCRRRGEEGLVVLKIHVSAKGAALDVKVERSSGSRYLDRAALSAAKRWNFIPATINGRAVAQWMRHSVRFRLEG